MDSLKRIQSCKNCGGELLPEDRSRNGYRCRYCGSFNVDDITNLSEAETLYIQAESDRENYKFDDAIARYKKAIEFAPYTEKFYWGLMLAEYGVVYIKDYDESLKPTFNRAHIISVLENENYKKVIDNSSDKDSESYQNSAKILEKTRQDIIDEINKEKEPYHIFISFKKTTGEKDSKGEEILTKDFAIAQNLYHQLTNIGYKVFFSEISLAYEKGKYEANIYTAINQSKVMIVVATNPNYLKTVWVQNEILRFKERIQPNSELDLIPICNNNGTISSLPFSLNNYQAINLEQNPMGIDDILLNRLKKTFKSRLNIAPKSVIEKKEFKANTKFEKLKEIDGEAFIKKDFSKVTTAIEIPENEELKLRKAEKFLEMDRFDFAKNLYESILEDNPNSFFAIRGNYYTDNRFKNDSDFINSIKTKAFNIDFTFYEKLISLAPNKENALKCINVLFDATVMLINNNDERRLDYYIHTIPWLDDDNLKLLNDLYVNFLKESLDEKLLKEFFTVIKYIAGNDTKTYYDKLKEYADYSFSKSKFDFSKGLYGVCLNIKNDSEIRWGYILSVLKAGNEDMLVTNFKNLEDHSLIEKLILSCKDRNAAVFYINKLINVANKLLLLNDLDLAKRLFNETVCWIDKDMENRKINILDFADNLLKSGYFEDAKMYYNEVLSINIKESKAHWGLLKCRLKVRNDAELKYQNENLLDMQEFHNAINCEDKEFEVFMDVAKEQQDYIKNKQEEAIRKEKQKTEEAKKIVEFKKSVKITKKILFLIVLNIICLIFLLYL